MKKNLFVKNKTVDLEIVDFTNEGEGVGRAEGCTFFVKDAVIGDVVTALITKVMKNYVYARVKEIIIPSPYRIPAPCPDACRCGGCQIQPLSYEMQLHFKQNKVLNNLVRIGGFDRAEVERMMEPILGMEDEEAPRGAASLEGRGCQNGVASECETERTIREVSSETANSGEENSRKHGGNERHDGTQLTVETGSMLPSYFRYRNKAQYPIGTDKSGNLIAGFFAGRTHAIIPLDDCLIGIPENKMILDVVLKWMRTWKISAYDETSHTGCVRHILIRKGFSTGELMVCLVVNADRLPREEELVQALSQLVFDGNEMRNSICQPEAVPNGNEEKVKAAVNGAVEKPTDSTRSIIKSISYSTNKNDTNVIMGDAYTTVYGTDTITDYIGDLKFEISPLSFYQVNPVQTQRLYEKALSYANLNGTETVWDLYCGIGTISLFLAQKAKHVYGVEVVPQAINDARRNAELNGLTNMTFFVGKAEEVVDRVYREAEDEKMGVQVNRAKNAPDETAHKKMIHPDVVVVDPPRKGCDELCLTTILKMSPKRIVYVSCDSATLSRDLKLLTANGYHLDKVCACDMFPNTVHVETVCLLGNRK